MINPNTLQNILSTIKVIVLDRDGVINEDSPEYIKSPAAWHAIPGSPKAIAQLNSAGFIVVAATNQSGIARGYFTSNMLEAIHQKMEHDIAAAGGHLDGIFVCPHGPEDHCSCRKPKPGLLIEIAHRFQVAPQEMLVIGDSMRDLLAAHAAGCKSILVRTGNGNKTLLEKAAVEEFPGSEASTSNSKNEENPTLLHQPNSPYHILKDVAVFDNLAAAVAAIVQYRNR